MSGCRMYLMNPAASAFTVACRGISERMGNIIIPYGSKILRRLAAESFKFIVCLLSVLFITLQGHDACGKVYIDIDSPTFQKFPIAITDFKKINAESQRGELASWFPDTLGKYLGMTGYFNIIERGAFLENQKLAGLTAESIRFADWTAIGAEYLVKGAFLYTGRELTAEFRLFDVVKGEVVSAKRYTGKIEDRNEIVRRIAGEILTALTGEEGVFNTKIAFVVKKGQVADIHTINFDGTELARITNHKSIIVSPRWSPDGRYISFTSYKDGNPDLYIKTIDAAATEKIAGYDGLNMAGSWSQDGRRLLLTLSKDGNENIYRMELRNRKLERITSSIGIDISPAWSPDNQRIAFVSNRSGSPQIFIMDNDGNAVKRLTYEGNYNTSPSWSPKGKRIVFEGSVNGRFQIFSIDEDGSNLLQLTSDNADHESPSWSPDGRYLAFSSRGGGKCRICVMNANGLNTRILYETVNDCKNPSWSPRMK